MIIIVFKPDQPKLLSFSLNGIIVPIFDNMLAYSQGVPELTDTFHY